MTFQFTCTAGVFSQFQEAPNKSYELVNSDFYVGFPWRCEQATTDSGRSSFT